MDPITILSALLPLVVHGGKAAINKWLGSENFKPSNIEEYGKIKDKELDLFKAINEAGGNNPSYAWVEAIVRLQRPFVVVCVLTTWAYANYVGWENLDAVNNAAAVVAFYLFGDRSLFYASKKGS
jgi:hypothetical protein